MDPNAQTFNSKSDQYQSARPRYPQELYEILNAQCSVHQNAWDCGCGNGQVAIDLVEVFQQVEASDINENQIRAAIAHPRIRYTVQKSEATDYADASFDAVCAAQCMHWFDLDRFFAEAKRVLKKEGIFACWGYGFFKTEPDLDRVLAQQLLEKIDPYWSDRNRLLCSGYQGVEFPFEPMDCPPVAMVMPWTLNELLEYLSTWSAVKLYDNAQGTAIMDNVRRELTARFDLECQYSVAMDFFVYMGRNR